MRIHDYIRDADATATSEIPRAMWLAAVTDASDRETVFRVGAAALQAGVFDVAQPKWEVLAEQGDTTAQFNLGVALKKRGDDTEAEAWFRRAAGNVLTDVLTDPVTDTRKPGELTRSANPRHARLTIRGPCAAR